MEKFFYRKDLIYTIAQEQSFSNATEFTPNMLFEMDRLTTLYSYVEQGIAASLVSDTLVRNIRGVDHDQIVFYMLPTEHTKRSIYISYKKNKYCTKAMTKLIENLSGLL